MTTQNTRTERMKLLKAQIEYHNNLYYNQDNPEISDAAYDALVRELRELEGNSPTLDSPTQKIGGIAQSTFKKTLHTIPLLSLKDVFDVSEVKNWIASIPDNISKKKFVVEEKVDGLSIAITYVNGIFTSAATRGDGQIGEDVTENARMIANIPKKISQLRFENEVIVRAEVIMPTATFDEVNKQLELEGKPLFKNPRNAAAGSLRTKDASITEKRGLQAIAFQILYEKNAAFLRNSQSKDIQYLSDFGFDIVSCKECDNIDDIVFAIEEIGNARKKSDYWIDGAVVKCNDIALQNQLGNTSKYPRWAVAFKYPPEQKETIVREIITQTGRTGVITPVAVFDPVLLCGTSVSRATLHNQQFMDNILGGVAVGDTILVHKSGEIIPEVLKVFHEKRPSDANPFQITTCPVCGSEAIITTDENGSEGAAHICTNTDCPAKTEGLLTYWCSKHVMDIDGFGPAIIRSLIDEGKLTCISDLYRLTEEDLSANSQIGPVRAPKLFAAIQKSKGHDIDRLIAGLGIPGIGRSIGKELASNFHDIWEISKASQEELMQLDGIGEISAKMLHSFFQTDSGIEMLYNLSEFGVNITSLSSSKNKSRVFDGMTFVITGTLPSMTRDEVSELISQNGGKVSSGVSKKTTYLVAGEAAGSKLKKAQDLGVKILSEFDLKAMLI